MSPSAISESTPASTVLEATPVSRKHDPNASFGASDLFALATPPKFEDKEKERQYLKEHLAAAVRIFAKYGFDHHVVRCMMQTISL